MSGNLAIHRLAGPLSDARSIRFSSPGSWLDETAVSRVHFWALVIVRCSNAKTPGIPIRKFTQTDGRQYSTSGAKARHYLHIHYGKPQNSPSSVISLANVYGLLIPSSLFRAMLDPSVRGGSAKLFCCSCKGRRLQATLFVLPDDHLARRHGSDSPGPQPPTVAPGFRDTQTLSRLGLRVQIIHRSQREAMASLRALPQLYSYFGPRLLGTEHYLVQLGTYIPTYQLT